MKKTLFLCIAVAALGCVACKKDHYTTDGFSAGVSYLRFAASCPDTRTILDPATGAVAWEDGDVLKVVYRTADSTCTTTGLVSNLAGGGRTALITVAVPDDSRPAEGAVFYAAYPAAAGLVLGGEAGADSLSVVIGEGDGTFKGACYMAASSTAEAASFNFITVGSIIRLEKPSFAEDVVSANVCAFGNETAVFKGGHGALALISEGGITGFTPAADGDGYARATISEEAAAADYYYIPAYPVSISGGYAVYFNCRNGRRVPAALSESGSLDVERGHIRPIDGVESHIVYTWNISNGGSEGDIVNGEKGGDLATFLRLARTSRLKAGALRLNGAKIRFADGTYSLPNTIAFNNSSNAFHLTVEGGSADNVIFDGHGAAVLNGKDSSIFFLGGSGSLDIKNICFTGGNRTVGGGFFRLYSKASSTVNFEDCVFDGNKTTKDGGAVSLNGSGSYNFSGCTFNANTAGTKGGAIGLTSTTCRASVDGCTFTGNTCLTYGGAICASSGLTVTDSSFDGNSCTQQDSSAGGASIFNDAADTLRINRCQFQNGLSYSRGGAIRQNGSDGVTLVNASLFANNKVSTSYGSAIQVSNGWVGVNNCTFNLNSSANKSANPGPISFGRGIVTNCTFVESFTSSQGVLRCVATSAQNICVAGNIVINTSTSATAAGIGTDNDTHNYFTGGYNLISTITDVFTAASDIPTNVTGFTKALVGINKLDATLHCYPWAGTKLSSAPAWSKATLAQMTALVNSCIYGQAFLNWLDSDEMRVNGHSAFEVDARGVERDTNAMWPGSYQKGAGEN